MTVTPPPPKKEKQKTICLGKKQLFFNMKLSTSKTINEAVEMPLPEKLLNGLH